MHVASQSHSGLAGTGHQLARDRGFNYRCRYCYAHWEEGTENRELLHDEAACRRLLATGRIF
jgi:sulfatase maturation enzyme AslB (radical SAM superfamily)